GGRALTDRTRDVQRTTFAGSRGRVTRVGRAFRDRAIVGHLWARAPALTDERARADRARGPPAVLHESDPSRRLRRLPVAPDAARKSGPPVRRRRRRTQRDGRRARLARSSTRGATTTAQRQRRPT